MTTHSSRTHSPRSENSASSFVQQVKALLELVRITNCLLVAAFTVAGFLMAASKATPLDIVLIAASMSLACAFGNALNDYLDLDSDAKAKPFRPIPSGRMNRETAITFIILTAIISLILAFFTSRPVQSAALIATVLALLVFYSARLKRTSKLSGNVLVSVLVASPLFLPAIAFQAAPRAVILGLGFSAFLVNLSREIVKDSAAKKTNAIIKNRERGTLTELVGETNARQTASLLLAAAVGVSVLTNDWTATTTSQLWRTVLLFSAYASISASAITLARINMPEGRLKFQEGAVKAGMALAVLAYLVP